MEVKDRQRQESEAINRDAHKRNDDSYASTPLMDGENGVTDNQDNLFVEKPKVQKSWRESNMRWLALTLACCMMLGNYMSYDYPSYLQSQIYEQMFGADPEVASGNAVTKYNWLYSIYSLPNFILPLFGGFLIDKIGVRTGNFVFTSILLVGQAICMLSGPFSGGNWGSTSAYVWMMVGRFVFALGGENLGVTQSTVISKWFYGKLLAMALGVTVSTARMGSVLGGWLLPAIFGIDNGLFLPLLFADIFCLLGIIAALGLNYMDRKADEQEGKLDQANNLDETEQVKLSDVKEFSLLYWLIALSCVMNYICLFVFLQNSNTFLVSRFQVDKDKASRFVTIPYMMSMVLTPFMGILVDKIGRRQWLLLAASSVMVIAHVMWLVMPECPLPDAKCSAARYVVPLVLMGVFYSCYAAVLWPCIPLVVPQKVVGTGFGVAYSLQNFGLFVSPLIVSAIIENTTFHQGYGDMSVFFVCCAIFCVLVSLAIIIVNGRTGNPIGRIMNQEQKKSIARRSSIMVKN